MNNDFNNFLYELVSRKLFSENTLSTSDGKINITINITQAPAPGITPEVNISEPAQIPEGPAPYYDEDNLPESDVSPNEEAPTPEDQNSEISNVPEFNQAQSEEEPDYSSYFNAQEQPQEPPVPGPSAQDVNPETMPQQGNVNTSPAPFYDENEYNESPMDPNQTYDNSQNQYPQQFTSDQQTQGFDPNSMQQQTIPQDQTQDPNAMSSQNNMDPSQGIPQDPNAIPSQDQQGQTPPAPGQVPFGEDPNTQGDQTQYQDPNQMQQPPQPSPVDMILQNQSLTEIHETLIRLANILDNFSDYKFIAVRKKVDESINLFNIIVANSSLFMPQMTTIIQQFKDFIIVCTKEIWILQKELEKKEEEIAERRLKQYKEEDGDDNDNFSNLLSRKYS